MFEVKAKSLLIVPGAVRYSAFWEVPARIGLIIFLVTNIGAYVPEKQ
jgi:hypothetical protein